MNPFDFVKAAGGGDSLMPVLIFIIWIVISFFSNAKKKKIRQAKQQSMKRQVPETYHAPESAAPPATMTQKEEKRAPLYDEIRRELETVLSGTQPLDGTAKESQSEDGEFTLETNEVEEKSYEMTAPVAVKSEPPSAPLRSSTVPFNAYSLAVLPGESEGIESTAITDVFSKDHQEKSAEQLAEQLIVVREEVRKGFVWSEILSAPVALRDQS